MKAIKANIPCEFFCCTCGKKTRRIDMYDGIYYFRSDCVLPTHPMRLHLKPLCKACWEELEKIKKQLNEKNSTEIY